MLRYNKQRKKEVMLRLSFIDPLGLKGWIAKKTKYGDRPGPAAWHYTKQFLEEHGEGDKLDELIAAFDRVGVQDEVDAMVWLAEMKVG
jgi:hypothetical protein